MWLILPYKTRRKKRYPTTVAWKVITDVVGGAGVSHLEDWFHLSNSLLLLGSISQPLANRSPGLKTTRFIRKRFGSHHKPLPSCLHNFSHVSETRRPKHSFGHFDTWQPKQTYHNCYDFLVGLSSNICGSWWQGDEAQSQVVLRILKNFLTAGNMSTCYTSNVGRRLNMGEPIFSTCPKMFAFPRKKKHHSLWNP